MIYPLNLPNPIVPACQSMAPKGSVLIYAGSNLYFALSFPVVIMSLNDTPLLTIDKSGDGGIRIGFQIFDDRGDIIAHSDNNSFWIRSDTRMEKPDKSHLIVYDHRDKPVLDIRFLNAKTIEINGELRHADYLRTAVPISARNFNNSCIGGSAKTLIRTDVN